MRKLITRLLRDDEGQDLVEYVLLDLIDRAGGRDGVSSRDRGHHGGVHRRRGRARGGGGGGGGRRLTR